MSEYSILQTRVLGVVITNIIKRDGKVIDKITAVQDLINLTTRVAELESQLNNRPESEAERVLRGWGQTLILLDRNSLDACHRVAVNARHYHAAQLARKLAGETTTKGE